MSSPCTDVDEFIAQVQQFFFSKCHHMLTSTLMLDAGSDMNGNNFYQYYCVNFFIRKKFYGYVVSS